MKYQPQSQLLVGNEDNDDAAVFDLGDGKAIISTTDFFTPIVDDPFVFGKIASVNALSDIYAMGGQPIMATAILAWPTDKLPLEMAQQVIEGARKVCNQAGIALSGGHSINISDPVFGLAVTGQIATEKIKRNSGASINDSLFLTKPIGTGVLSTAEKQMKLTAEDRRVLIDVMCELNQIGAVLSESEYVSTMTDVTGFGLLGHLVELCQASNVAATIHFSDLPLIQNLDHYIKQDTIPGGTFRNHKAYQEFVSPLSDYQKKILCDPQTSGGLLVAVNSAEEEKVIRLMEQHQQLFVKIGQLEERSDKPLVQIV